jgi:hypothetical protein
MFPGAASFFPYPLARNFTVEAIDLYGSDERHYGVRMYPGADPGFVELQPYIIYGALFKKNNSKLRIQNLVEN